jgi:hypothetical protein
MWNGISWGFDFHFPMLTILSNFSHVFISVILLYKCNDIIYIFSNIYEKDIKANMPLNINYL